MTLKVVLDRVSSSNQTFTLLTSTANGMNSSDYSLIGGNQVTIAAGQTEASKVIQIINDDFVEGDELLTLTLSGGTGISIGSPANYILTVQNDDSSSTTPPPTVPSSVEAFTTTLYNNILRDSGSGRCLNCHRPNGTLLSVSPYHSHDDPTQAHNIIMTLGLVNLDNPGSSRLVSKVAGGHNSWSGNASADAKAIQDQIQAWSDMLKSNPGTPTPTPTPTSNLKTNQLTMSQGISVTGNRYDTAAIALWDFREGSGTIIHDKSNVTPAMDLSMQGNIEWLGGQGIRCKATSNGNHWARNNNASKLYNEITKTNEFSIEVWGIAENDSQEGPSRILSYSNGTNNRNFTMGQEGPYLNFRLRSKDNSNNGSDPAYQPMIKVFDDRATANHMVMTFSGKERKIYVNGRQIKENNERDALYDGQFKPLINNIGTDPNWNIDYDLVLCNETSGNRIWKGDIFFAAIHKRALTENQIIQNFDAGYTEKTVLSFDISAYTNSGAVVQAVTESIDDKTYILSDLTFKGLDNPITVKGINVLINDTRAISGQSWAIVNRIVQNNQDLSLSAPVIAADKGPAMDKFSLSFDQLGSQTNVIASPIIYAYENSSIPTSTGETPNQIGTKDFMELNQTFANLTGVSTANAQAQAAYEELKEGLPIGSNIDAFSSTNQINITKLSYQYCSEMVANTTLRNNFFGVTINTSTAAATAFNTTTINAVVNAIAIKIQTDISTNPSKSEVTTEVQGLIQEMKNQGKTTRDILVGTCMLATSSSSALLK